MAVTIYGLIQHRRGVRADLPVKLEEGELGFCVDTRQLFIGNTVAQGGNTQIFTDAVDVVQLASYSFVSDTLVPSQTGASMNQPVVRSLQAQLDDAWVNVKAYGAQGDGITDDTVAINRAIQDLYTKQLTTSEHVSQARKTIWFPSGEYVITQPILVYPQVALRGESRQNTTIMLRNTQVAQDHVVELVDSVGQTRLNMGLNGALLPTHVQFTDLTIASAHNIDLVWLSRYAHVQFVNCGFQGVWQSGDPVVPGSHSVAIRAETLGNLIVSEQLHFSNCVFQNIELAFYSTDPVRIASFSQCKFTQLHKAIWTDQRVAPDPEANSGPAFTRVVASSFVNIDSHAVQVQSDNPGVVSMGNVFVNVGVVAAVVPMLWSAVSTKCVSIADQFTLVPGVQDLGMNNLIINTQQSNLNSQLTVAPTMLAGTFYPVLSSVTTGVTSAATSPLFTIDPDPTAPVLNVQAEIRSQGWVQNYNEDTVNATINLGHMDQVVGVAPGATVNLPATPASGKTYTIKDVVGTASVTPISVQPGAGASVDAGAPNAAYVLNTNWGAVTLMYKSSGNKWLIL